MLTALHLLIQTLYVACLGVLLTACIVGCVVCINIAWINRKKPVDPNHRSSRHE